MNLWAMFFSCLNARSAHLATPKNNLLGRLFFGLFLLLCVGTVSAQVAVPDLSRRVTDLTGTLTTDQTNALESKLAAFESEKGSQIAVLIIASTQPEDIAAFGIRVADAWKVGRKNIDDGVILIVAKNDRRLRFEVGYGLEGAIPDAIAKRIIDETITPYFKQGDFASGIDAGVTQVMTLIRGESLPAPQNQESNESFPLPLAILLIFLLVNVVLRVGSPNGRNSGWFSSDASSSGGDSSWSGGGGDSGGGGASGSW